MLDNTFLPMDETCYGTTKVTSRSLRKTTRESLISTWRTKAASRSAYEGRAAHHINLKVRFSEVAPQLSESLRAADVEGKGYILQHELQHVLLIQFGILLGAVELECLKAEWKVLDPVTQHVDYTALIDMCSPGTLHDYVAPLTMQRTADRQAAAEFKEATRRK